MVVFLFSTSLLPPRPVLMASTVWMSFSQVGQHDFKDAGQRHGIIDSAVMVEGRDLQMLVDGVQLVVA